MNIQNIPRKDKLVKRAFQPKLDALLCCDYDQVEMRFLAWYMYHQGDSSMVEAFLSGADLHEEAAKAVLGITGRACTDEERQVGKTFNYSIIFGGGRPTIMKQLGIDWGEAGTKLKAYHARWPGIQLLQQSLEQIMESRGYVMTVAGRHLAPEQSHVLINSICQGSAAEIMRWGMVKVDKYLGARLMASHLVNTVHDEVMIDAVFGEIPQLVVDVPKLMDYAPVSEVIPLGVAVEWTTTTWADKALYKGELG